VFGWLFGSNPEKEAKQLIRDVPLILEQARGLFSEEGMQVVADTAREHIERAHNIYGTEGIDLDRALYDYRKLHKDARRRTEQRVLSGLTLVIIYLRAEKTGAAADPARAAIETFIAEYPSVAS